MCICGYGENCLQELLDNLTVLDRCFNYREPAPVDVPWYETVTGEVPVLVSAPHACMHLRDGEYKMPEEYTGAIALYLAQTCGCHALVARYKTDEDPNWQTNSVYKQQVARIVKDHSVTVLIDLHGMTNRYHMGAAIGTLNGRSCHPSSVVEHFVNAGFNAVTADSLPAASGRANKYLQDKVLLTSELRSSDNQSNRNWRNVVVDHPRFTGGLVSHTVTRYAAEQLGIQSVQIELASIARVVHSLATADWPMDYRGNSEAITCSVKALQALVNSAGKWHVDHQQANQ